MEGEASVEGRFGFIGSQDFSELSTPRLSEVFDHWSPSPSNILPFLTSPPDLRSPLLELLHSGASASQPWGSQPWGSLRVDTRPKLDQRQTKDVCQDLTGRMLLTLPKFHKEKALNR